MRIKIGHLVNYTGDYGIGIGLVLREFKDSSVYFEVYWFQSNTIGYPRLSYLKHAKV